MDPSRLDDLTRFLGQRTGRRLVATGVLGSLLATLVPELSPAGAARKKRKKAACKKPKRRCGKRCVNVKTSRQHCGKCNRKCKPTDTCRQGKCTPPPCGKGGPCRVFLTRSEHDGNLDGLSGADAICGRAAGEANLPGTYKAWLSSAFGSPASRFIRNPGPYVLLDDTIIADTWEDLTDGTLLAPINVMEDGQRFDGFQRVWTGTTVSGTWSSFDCAGWTINTGEDEGVVGTHGSSALLDSMWTDQAVVLCDRRGSLFCFQQS